MTATEACWGSRPVAKALGAASLMTYTAGMGMPAAIDISSTTSQRTGAWSCVTRCARLAARTMPAPP